ncbi:MAG: hypothetical protein IJ618_09160 [Prevotella sp.]|nr:hypothetical protein [Prevotella sp.]
MTYDQQILEVLTAVGEKGISVQLLAKHVYNANLSLFFTPSLEEIRTYIQQYLLKNSKLPSSLIEKMERRGYYRLNTRNNSDAQQLMINFREEQLPGETEENPEKSIDLSLDLFS